MRWIRPRSSCVQSEAEIGRGRRQKGKIFSVPRWSLKTENVTPWLSSDSSASAWLRENSEHLVVRPRQRPVGGEQGHVPSGGGWSPGSRRRSSVQGVSGWGEAGLPVTGHASGPSTVNRCARRAAASKRVSGGVS